MHHAFPQIGIAFLLQAIKQIGCVGVAALLSWLIDSAQLGIQLNDTSILWNCFSATVLYAVILGIITYLTERAKAGFLYKMQCRLRQEIMEAYITGGRDNHYQGNSAKEINLLNQSMQLLEENYLKNILGIWEGICGVVFATALLLMMNIPIALISILFMTIPSLLPKLFSKALAKRQGTVTKACEEYNIEIKDTLQGMEVIKNYEAGDYFKEKDRVSAQNMEGQKKAMMELMAVVLGMANMSSLTVQFFIMSIAGFFAIKGYVTLGSMIAVTQLTGQVIAPAFALAANLGKFHATKPIIEEIQNLLASKEANLLETSAKQVFSSQIELQNMDFQYEEKKILNQVNLTIEKGKKYAVSGKSGSGKSTILKLIAGYFPPTAGKILTDGKEGSPENLVFINQDVFLFDTTVEDNIKMGGNYTGKEVEEVLEKVGLADLIRSLPQGIKTPVEENGKRFSGGEKQRISIARALLHQKDLFLVDEATSALDYENAEKIEELLTSLEGVTCICVTHRLDENILGKYDSLLVMEEGKITDKVSSPNNIAALLKNNSLAAKAVG